MSRRSVANMLLLALALLASALAPAAAQSPERLALVIGNKDYSGALTPLNRPHEDIRVIAGALGVGQFEVTSRKDLGRDATLDEVNAFAARLRKAGPQAIGFFYYSGHGGSALKGTRRSNYLIPARADVRFADDLISRGVSLDDIVDILSNTGARAVFIVFDACRTELPWAKGSDSPDKAFGAIAARPGMLIAFATDAGASAPDDGAFADALAEQLVQPDLPHLLAFDAAAQKVGANRGTDRLPWFSNQIRGQIYLRGMTARPVLPQADVARPPAPAARTTPASGAGSTPMDTTGAGRDIAAPGASVTDAPPSLRAGETFRDCSACPEMVVIPSGSFLMGSPASEAGRGNDEGPQRRVSVPTFAAGKYEVTWTEYGACASAGACAAAADDGFGRGARPVTNVSWNDAKAYVAWLTRETGKTYRLLSEAEWEYAARAGTTTPFSFGSTLSTSQANYDGTFTYGNGSKGEYRRKTAPVGSFPANAFGLFDLHGNVWEWVEDCYAAGYSAGQPANGAAYAPGSCSNRVYRGGSWYNDPQVLRSAIRIRSTLTYRKFNLGFRVARTL